MKSPSDGLVHPDYDRVKAILAGNGTQEYWFTDAYSDRIMRTAIQWCRLWKPASFCYLCQTRRRSPLEALEGRLHIERQGEKDCDEAYDAYLFILSQLRQVCLARYEGRCSLSTFLYPVLHPIPPRDRAHSYHYYMLFADYLREKHGRVRPPQCVKELGKRAEDVFVRLVRQDSEEQIARELSLELAEIRLIEQDLESTLKRNGWSTYWFWWGSRQHCEVEWPSPLDSENSSLIFDPPDLEGKGADEMTHANEVLRRAYDIAKQKINELQGIEWEIAHHRYQLNWSVEDIAKGLSIDAARSL